MRTTTSPAAGSGIFASCQARDLGALSKAWRTLDLPLPRIPNRRDRVRRFVVLEVCVDHAHAIREPNEERRLLIGQDRLNRVVRSLARRWIVVGECDPFGCVQARIAELIDILSVRWSLIAHPQRRVVGIHAVGPAEERDVEFSTLDDAALTVTCEIQRWCVLFDRRVDSNE